MSEVKQIQITGGAELMGGKRRRSRKGEKGSKTLQVQKGGNCVKGYLNPMLMSAAAPLNEAFNRPVPLAELSKPVPVAAAALPSASQAGGSTTKVELRKAPPHKKVLLHSKKTVPLAKGQTKRKTRKIILGLKAMEHRMTRAKKISQRMKEMPIEQLKKQLVEQGLIQAGSKAPESILRQIAADAQIVGGNGL